MSDLPKIVVTDGDEAIDRAAYALTMFVFPGIAVPRSEMARAVVHALTHHDDPRVGIAKTIVRVSAPFDDDTAASAAPSAPESTP